MICTSIALLFSPRKYALSQPRARVETCNQNHIHKFSSCGRCGPVSPIQSLCWNKDNMYSDDSLRVFLNAKMPIFSTLFGEGRPVAAQSVCFYGSRVIGGLASEKS